jgi:hypothetical protein
VGKRFSLWITAGITIAGLVVVILAYGCTPSEDPAEALLKAQGVSTSAPAAKPASSTPADTAKTTGAPAGGTSAAPAGGAAAGKAAAPDGGTSTSKPGAATPAAPGEKDTTSKEAGGAAQKPAEGAAASGGKDAEAEPKTGFVMGDKEAEKAGKKSEGDISEDERITNFQNLEPRDIILKKYDNMHQKLSEPWNAQKDKEDFIPETGRVDPLNPVDSAIPDEFKPPRSGETDANQIQTYLVAAACTQAVDAIRLTVQVRNVLKIGAETYVTISVGNRSQSLTVGNAFSGYAGSVGFIPIIFTVTVSSATASEVVLDVSAYGDGTSTSVSKSQIYLPTTFTG